MSRPASDVAARSTLGADQAAAAGGGLLSVGELQLALRTVLTARNVAGAPTQVGRPPAATTVGVPLGPWVAVVGATAGAGCSTVALLLAEALTSTGRPVHLVDPGPAARSGLAGVTTAELGVLRNGGWRRGTRGQITVDRRAEDGAGTAAWPRPPAGLTAAGSMTVVDVGAWPGAMALGADGDRDPASPRVVLVARATAAGSGAAERVLTELGSVSPACVAVVGPRRLPGHLRSGRGPRLAQMYEQGRVVAVPVDGRLDVAGLSTGPLPRSFTSPGNGLLELLERDGLRSSTADRRRT